MDWEKSGPVCTEDQAAELTDRMLGNFWCAPERLEMTVSIWTEGFREWPYKYAKAAVKWALDKLTSERMPPYGIVREYMNELALRDQGLGGR